MSATVDAALDDRQQKAKVFISYSRKDMAFADQLEAALRARGIDALIDRSEIYAFEDWWKRIEALVAKADTVVFVLSPDAVASEVALKELAYAASLNKRFAPIVCRRVAADAVPEPLRRLNFIFFDDAAQVETSADQLVDALQTDIDWIRKHTELGEAARRWAAAGHPRGLLLRSPVLEDAERWIATRPGNAPAPTEETQRFLVESRKGAMRRRNILTGSLATGLTVALVLSGLAYWQREIAVEQRGIALAERDKATHSFNLAQQTADSLVVDIARGLRNVRGMSAESVRKILETARATFEQLAASAPDNLALQRSRSVMLDEFGETFETLGDLEEALKSYRDSLAIRKRLAGTDLGNTQWQRDLSVSYGKIGEALVRRGKLEEAFKAYSESLAIAERLAATDPNNALWQRDLSVSYDKIGDVLVRQGKLEEAVKTYHAGLGIKERLAAADRDNTEWQRDLSLSYISLGDVLVRQGKLEEALRAYSDSLTIRERLAAAEPGNTEWQSDLTVSYNNIGDVLVRQGKLEGALQAFRDGLAIAERLAAGDRSNTQWQRDLSVSYEKIGNVLVRQGKLEEALKAYRACHAIAERLAVVDRNNAEWQSDLALSYEKLGDVLVRQGKLEEALKAYRDSLTIAERLAAADPTNREAQRDLSVSYNKIGDVLVRQGNLGEALKVYRGSLAIRERLAVADRSNAEWQRDLSVSYGKLGDVLVAQGKLEEALKAYRDGLAISRHLAATDRSNAEWQNDVRISIGRVGSMAYRFVLGNDFAKALEVADHAISLAPDAVWLYTNRAHALMFLGRADQARALYLQYRGENNVQNGKSWNAIILEDFAELRLIGLSHPLMDEIETKFTARG